MSDNNYDISILIPSRNEAFLTHTIKDILKNIRGKTEIIVGLDGQWATPGVEDHPNVKLLYYPESIGQRAMTNQLCRLSTAKYIIKTDAHCAFDEGFDIKLLEAIKGHDDWTIVPTMRNLHVFDWVCKNCGDRRYQGMTPTDCPKCSNKIDFKKDIVWIPKPSPQSNSFKFDTTLHFQYFREYDKREGVSQELSESMSLQGSFFMLTRERYWALNICDEKTGSWGQQGVEVACKTWLSGGKVMCCKTTWYAHLFRTAGGDFSFPYPITGNAVERARRYSRDIWFNNKFEKQVYPLSWLIDKFKPVGDWHDESGKAMYEQVQEEGKKFYERQGKRKGIIYFTDNQLNMKIARSVRNQLRKINLPIVSASLKPMDFGQNIVLPLKRGVETMLKQIIAALEASTVDIVFFCEHDVLYHPSHFDFIPKKKDKFYYNQNWWKVWSDGFAAHWDANQVSGLCSYREYVLQYYKERLKEVEEKGFNRSYEPGARDESKYEVWNSDFPNVDIRHDNNLTTSHRSIEDFRDKSTSKNFQESSIDLIPGWKKLKEKLSND